MKWKRISTVCLDEEEFRGIFNLLLNRPPKRRHVHPTVDPFALLWNENEFLKRFCLHEDTATEVMLEVRHLIISRTNKNPAISPDNHKNNLVSLLNRHEQDSINDKQHGFCCFVDLA